MKELLTGLYVITDPNYCNNQLIEKVDAALKGGANIIQYRNKLASPDIQLKEAEQLALLCHEYNKVFVINDDADLARAVDADGVHLGQTDLKKPGNNIQAARSKLGKEKIIGITCHQDLELATLAQHEGADYVAFGRFFPSSTKPLASAANINWLPSAKKQLHLPVAAIGGINTDNASALLDAGADMLAVIHAVLAHETLDDIYQAARIFSQICQQHMEN